MPRYISWMTLAVPPGADRISVLQGGRADVPSASRARKYAGWVTGEFALAGPPSARLLRGGAREPRPEATPPGPGQARAGRAGGAAAPCTRTHRTRSSAARSVRMRVQRSRRLRSRESSMMSSMCTPPAAAMAASTGRPLWRQYACSLRAASTCGEGPGHCQG